MTQTDPHLEQQTEQTGPIARLHSLKLIAFGVVAMGLAGGIWLAGVIPIYIFSVFLLFGPVMIYMGLIQLILPQHLHRSSLHERLDHAGVVTILLLLVAYIGWSLWAFIR